ncbi:hypothetical protein C2S52_000847 [Perilla frutescens var. hirtella]|uniref:C2HC zinc finger plants domain-containing protein n=1 Tax=Perilla frutescens var. hirtella TaxID=608512 RepID=A0AAD4P980_PERFH|nr:hypothetical protein C2S51_007530 [Perilla frutescens var. frutescens]KAH6800383.1 hypothetical protein C2S52_000847 [Perilla frutescens var. hirtella]KAH6831654.1 hypothetical protein C2S53_009129 [Perilla frutescens var. hirtella]
MNGGDADMMEAEASAPPSAPPREVGPASDPNDVKNLLMMARRFIYQGKPSQALEAVMMAMKIQGGDIAVSEGMRRAQELYRNKIQASAAADELASLFAECAIAEAIPLPSGVSQQKSSEEPIEPDPQETSILAETGRKQIMVDAFSDGSSFVCLQCGGLVSNDRKEEHVAFWCCKA